MRLLLAQREHGIGLDGLHPMMIESGSACALTILLLSPAGDRNERHARAPGLLAHAFRHFVAVEARHADVEKRHVRLHRQDLVERELPVVGLLYFVAVQLQQHRKALCRIRVVVRDEHLQSAVHVGRRRGSRYHRVRDGPRDERQTHDELAPLPDAGAVRLDRPAVQIDEALRQREADAET